MPTHECPVCRRPVPEDAPNGSCPHCLLADGLDDSHNAMPSHEQLAAAFPELEIEGVIGSGGMGVVYRARQRTLDRVVALKVLSPAVSGDPRFAERFEREARALARLAHPHIVGVHESGERDGLFYLVMEFVDGPNLRQVIAAGELTPDAGLALVPQICDALQYAHDQGVVHRDVKPENLLLGRDGRLRIADFGLAKLVERDAAGSALTQRGQVMGTPHYMAPEQIERPGDVDHRADIYALGVVFYEMLTGELPLGRFAPPSRKVDVDVRFDEVVLRTLEKDRERRYQRAGDVTTEVRTIQESEVAPPPPAPVQVPDTPARSRFGRASRWGLPPRPAPGTPRLPRRRAFDGVAIATLCMAALPVIGLVHFLVFGATEGLATACAYVAVPWTFLMAGLWMGSAVCGTLVERAHRKGLGVLLCAVLSPFAAGLAFGLATPKLRSEEFERLREKIDAQFTPGRPAIPSGIESACFQAFRRLPLTGFDLVRMPGVDPEERRRLIELPTTEWDRLCEEDELGLALLDPEHLPVDLDALSLERADVSDDGRRATVTASGRTCRITFPMVRTGSRWTFGVGKVTIERLPE